MFLWAGLAATLTVVGHLGNPHAIWVALLFAMRGLTPPEPMRSGRCALASAMSSAPA